MLSGIREHLSVRHAGLLALCVLAWVYMALFRYDLYGIEEAAARALLINWSIIHQIASPVALFGVPDMRGFFFVLLDLHWAGSLVAAKVFTMLVLFASILLLYRWGERVHGAEPSMIACGLLPLLPISIMQADSVGGGVYLFMALLIIAWLNKNIQASEFHLPGQIFLQGVLVAFAITIHPIGLAAALVLAVLWWFDTDKLRKKRRNVLIALVIAVTIPLLLRMGWPDIAGMNMGFLPFVSTIFLGPDLLPVAINIRTGVGLICMVLLLVIFLVHAIRKTSDPFSLFLMVGLIVGSFHINAVWVFMAAVALLYLGAPVLIDLNQRLGWQGILGQRGVVLIVVFIMATTAMISDRYYRNIEKQHLLSETDQLIAKLASEASDKKQEFLVASEWPARTMLAVKRDVLPLPYGREGDDSQVFLQRISGVTHFVFDPTKEINKGLVVQFSALNAYYETIALSHNGVILKIRENIGE
ncbi:MAG: hypothetical protein Q9M22_01585 [Mariprofundaceae bacterium]|nr:hypothetical protein [Mariprofundaceae bacterium]